MGFAVRDTEHHWAEVRDYLLARRDVLSEFALYTVGDRANDWVVESDRAGQFIYAKGLVIQASGYKVHLSCNVVSGVWETFHVTEDHSGGLHVASLRVTQCGEEDEYYLTTGRQFRCMTDALIIQEGGKRSRMKVGKKEAIVKEKIVAKGGKISSPKKDMNLVVNAMADVGMEWI
jgi:hypothetical protein